MREIAGHDMRITKKAELKDYLANTYQVPIADLITNYFYKTYFNDYVTSINA